ncbi:Noroxomaritidine synthase [Vitis vinifera]|uniref:Noroxomaritidine synthase n=1 Tax=Vitis vinifera TaxID=29760 RepID=A0A438F576_VITVI|nr:Noroxomaritidine synthase [Vitis vinifera]
MALVSYPEILVAVIFFLFIGGFCSKKGVPWNWPIVGMFAGLLFHVHRIHDEAAEILEKTGCTFLFKGPWFCNMDMLGTTDPANSWRNQRKLGQSMINNPRFHRFLAKVTYNKVEKGLVPLLDHLSEQGRVVDLQDVFQRLTFDTTCMLVTGFDTKCLSIEFPEVPFATALEDVEEAVFYRHALPETLWRLLRWLGIGKEKKLRKGWKTLDHTIAEYISMKREELSKGITKLREDEDGADLLTSYMTEDNAIGLKCDALRLYPPVPFQHKAPIQPDVLPSGHKVDPKMKIFFPVYAMGRMTAIWGKDCLEFKPERWISELGKIKHEPSYKFFSFNAGPRTCIGKEVAFTQMKAVAATIIHNYHVEMVKGHHVAPNVSIILYMKRGFKVRVSKRWGG